MYNYLCLNKFCIDPDKSIKIFSTAGTTHTTSEETKRKISLALKGRPGGKHTTSEETKKKIGIANSKHHPSAELKNRISNTLKEKWRDDTTFVKKMKEIHKNQGPKISKAKKGVKQSEERKTLQSKVISKLWESEEYRKHMSDVHKGRKQPSSQIEKRRKTMQENRKLRESLGLSKKHYFTNGKDTLFTDICPEGWWKGKANGNRK